MTKQEILAKLKFDLELRGKSPSTVKDYVTKASIFQDHYDKPANQMREKEMLISCTIC